MVLSTTTRMVYLQDQEALSKVINPRIVKRFAPIRTLIAHYRHLSKLSTRASTPDFLLPACPPSHQVPPFLRRIGSQQLSKVVVQS